MSGGKKNPGEFLRVGRTVTSGDYILMREAKRRRGYKHDTYMVVLDMVTQSYLEDGKPYGHPHRQRRTLVGALSAKDARGLARSIRETVPDSDA